jgi:TorA maturation chaperone TorD
MNTLRQTPQDPETTRALQVLYHFMALTLADPRVGSWQELTGAGVRELVAAAAAVLREAPQTQAEPLGWGELSPGELDPAGLFNVFPTTIETLNAAYEQLFGLLVSGGCPPYETEYIDSKLSFQRSQALADIAGFYRAFGWSPASSHPERPDHIALELEFMGTLCGMELRAGREEDRAVCRDAQAKFLSEHLVWWAPALAKLLIYEDASGFYGAAGRLLASLLPAHRALLGVAPHHRPASPSFVERPEECNGCLLQPSEL